MNAVVSGFVVARSRTSGSVKYAYATTANATAAAIDSPRKIQHFRRTGPRRGARFASGIRQLRAERRACGGDTCAGWNFVAAQNERFLECGQELQQRLVRGACAHESDAPNLAGQRTQAGAHFDVERVEQRPA